MPVHFEYDGIIWKLYPDSRFPFMRRYFHNVSKISGKAKMQLLHRYMWEKHNGKIQKNHHVHHKNGDTKDNRIENLECVHKDEHWKRHKEQRSENGSCPAMLKHLERIRKDAAVWHSSEEGRKWHSEHGKAVFGDMYKKKETHKCSFFGKSYKIPTNARGTKYICSNKCYAEERRQSGVDDEIRTCSFCQKRLVVNKYSKTKCCSKSCSTRRSNMRKSMGLRN